jgi:hypothetical protein
MVIAPARLIGIPGLDDRGLSAAEGEPVHDRWWRLVEQIRGIPAFTWEGVKAKAKVVDLAACLLDDPQSAVDDLVHYVLPEVATWRGRP